MYARVAVRRYAVAWSYLGGFVVAEVVYDALPRHAQSAVTGWASTNVVNLRHDPVGSLVASAFISGRSAYAWPVLIALGLFGANRALGNTRTAVVCVAGHVVGTLVSEGIVAYRVGHGLLPRAASRLVDVGPSYVVVSAVVVALLCGSRGARCAAAVDFAVLVLGGRIFGGISHLEVAAVGHVTAITTAAVGVALLKLRSRDPGAYQAADPVGDAGGDSAERQLPYRAAQEGPASQP
jgi:hypothetical protein